MTRAAHPELSLLSGIELFVGVSPEGLDAVRASARIDAVDKEEIVFEQGGGAARAYALAEGSIRIVQTGSDGGQAIIRFITPGELFGTVPLFTNHRFPADAVATVPSQVLSWSEADLFALIDRYPRIGVNVIRIIGARLAEAQHRVRELSTQRAEQRIAHALLRLATQAGHDMHGAMAIDIPLRRKDLADVSGTTLHTASRTLAAWQKAGLLMSRDQRVTIRDLPAIARIADDLGH